MGVLLASDAVVVMRGTPTADEHGWQVPPDDAVPVWEGFGNLQEATPDANARAAEAGGQGPYGPAHVRGGTCYLPSEAVVLAGDTLLVRGQDWVVESVQRVNDPVGVGLDCLACVVGVLEAGRTAAPHG